MFKTAAEGKMPKNIWVNYHLCMVKVAEFDIDMVGQWEDKKKFVEAEE